MIMCSDIKFIFYIPESFKNTSCYKKRNKKLTSWLFQVSNNYFIDLKLFVFEFKSFHSIKSEIEKSYQADDIKNFWNVTPNQQRWQIYLMTSGVGKSPIQDFNSFTLWKTIQFRLNFNKRERNFNKKILDVREFRRAALPANWLKLKKQLELLLEYIINSRALFDNDLCSYNI